MELRERTALVVERPNMMLNEQRLLDIAGDHGCRLTVDRCLPDTGCWHKVECVVLEPSELASFTRALGILDLPLAPSTPQPARRRADIFTQTMAQLRSSQRDATRPEPDEPSLTRAELAAVASLCLSASDQALFMHKVDVALRKKECGA